MILDGVLPQLRHEELREPESPPPAPRPAARSRFAGMDAEIAGGHTAELIGLLCERNESLRRELFAALAEAKQAKILHRHADGGWRAMTRERDQAHRALQESTQRCDELAAKVALLEKALAEREPSA